MKKNTITAKDKKVLEALAQKEGFADALDDILVDLDNEELNGAILETFSTNEMIGCLDLRGELGEAAQAYKGDKSKLLITADKWEKKELISELLGITTLWTLEDHIEKLKELYENI